MRLFIPLVLSTLLTAADQAETFAFSDDRLAAAAALLPHSPDARWYRALALQQAGKLAEVDALLAAWPEDPGQAERKAILSARQAVLWYDQDAAKGLKLLREQVGWNSDHQPQDLGDLSVEAQAHQAAEQRLNPAKIQEALSNERWLLSHDMADATMAERLLALPVDDQQRRSLLRRLDLPTPAELPALVVADLAAVGSEGFGSLPIHQCLTVAQLSACRDLLPSLGAHPVWQTALAKGLTADLSESAERLAALSAFAAGPGASLPRLALALHQARVAVELTQGRCTRAAVVAWLGAEAALPAGTAEEADWAQVANLPTWAGTDNLKEACLEHLLLADPDSVADPALVKLCGAEDLRRRQAVARLEAGQGDAAASWAILPAAEARALASRSILQFAPGPRAPLPAAGPMTFALVLANVPELVVQTYALDQVAILRQGQTLHAGYDLRGVVPHTVRRIARDLAPVRRQVEQIAVDLPAGPGAWIVEFVGGGQAMRCMLQRGALSWSDGLDHAGMWLQPIDEDGQPQAGGQAWLNGQAYAAGADGRIRLPFSTTEPPPTYGLVVVAAGRAVAGELALTSEVWSLEADWLLDAEQIIPGAEAAGVVRLRPQLNRVAMPATMLEDVAIEVALVDGAGLRQVQRLAQQPKADRDLEFRFAVGEDCRVVDVTVQGRVASRSRGDVALVATHRLEVNSQRGSILIGQPLLRRTVSGDRLALLGRNGEPLPDSLLTVSATPVGGLQVGGLLTTNAAGEVELGQVPLTRLFLSRNEGDQVWTQGTQQPLRWPVLRHLEAGVATTLPWPEGETSRPRLFALAAGRILRELSDSVGRQDDRLTLTGLSAGTYRLAVGSRRVGLVVAERIAGRLRHAGRVLDEDLGQTPHLVARLDQGQVTVEVAGFAPGVRVHAVGRRFAPERSHDWPDTAQELNGLDLPRSAAEYRQAIALDAESRYILDRAALPHLPGVMAPRPGLLINPWKDPYAFLAIGAGGKSAGMFGGRNGGGSKQAVGRAGSSKSESTHLPEPCFDFLAAPGVLFANLRPDREGRLRLQLADLGDTQELELLAVDDQRSASILCRLPSTPPRGRDLRLAAPLAETPRAWRHEAVHLAAGIQPEPLDIALGESRRYADLAALHRLFAAGEGGGDLAEFAPLMAWDRLDEGARRTFYGTHACHEVDLFVYLRDRPFFDRVVRPLVAGKVQPDFLDDWLMERSLERHLAPQAHARLTVLERGLLAQRLPAGQREDEVRGLRRELESHADDAWQRVLTLALKNHLPPQAPPPRAAPELPAEPQIADVEGPAVPAAYHDNAAAMPLLERAWWGLPYNQHRADRLPMAQVWLDLAGSPAQERLANVACLGAGGSLSGALAALALVDLPFQADAAGPAILVRSGATLPPTGDCPLLVEVEEAIEDGSVLRCGRVVKQTVRVINAGAQAQTVALLAQIPAGSIALGGADRLGRSLALEPWAQHTETLTFYFPGAGAFTQFPATASTALGHVALPLRRWTVHAPGDRVERAQAASLAWHEMLTRLNDEGPERVDLSDELWRLTDTALCAQVVAAHRRWRTMDRDVWGYAAGHGDRACLADLVVSDETMRRRCGRVRAGWIDLDPRDSGDWLQVDLDPVVLRRAHPVAGQRVVPTLVATRWTQLLDRMARAELDPRDRLEAAYLLLLQDRVAEASAQLARCPRDAVPGVMQHDALAAWLALGRSEPALARTLAEPWRGQVLPRWNHFFSTLLAQLDEIAAPLPPPELAVAETKLTTLRLELAGGELVVQGQGRGEMRVGWHPIDIEPLFSSEPFRALVGRTATLTQPAEAASVPLAAVGATRWAVPATWAGRDGLITVESGDQRETVLNLAHHVDLRLDQATGQLQVFGCEQGTPLPATYVKVYATVNGSVVFWKDGYTDLRGRFDWRSIGSDQAGTATQFAILLVSDTHGATTRVVSSPMP